MDDVPHPDREQFAGVLAAVLEAIMLPVAESRDRTPSTAITPEEVDTITALNRLGQLLPDFCRRAILGEISADQWAAMSNILHAAGRTCRQHVVIEAQGHG